MMKETPLVTKPLPLKNEGELQLFFIGCGSANAKTMRQTNFLIVKGNDHVLVDLGQKGQEALWDTAGLDMTDVGVILPTHSHADHVGGLEGLALQYRYFGIPILKKEKPGLVVTEDYQRILWDRTLRGGLEYNEEEMSDHRLLHLGDYFRVIRPKWKTQQPREIHEVEVGKIHLELFRTKHTPDSSNGWQDSFVSYGLFIDGQVFVSGDTRFDPDLIELYAWKSRVMFHDCQFFDGGVHASLHELSVLPSEITEKMFLMHYGDNWVNQDVKSFAGFVKQGMLYTLAA